MEILNIIVGNHVQQVGYEYDSGIYTFEKDIHIGEWVVSRLIKIGGPKGGSIYKYDFRNYFEFVITDANGSGRILTWNHNAGDNNLKRFWGNTVVDALPFFFENHPVFSARDWEDYKYLLALRSIKKVLDEKGLSAKETITKISNLIDVDSNK